VWNSKLTIVTHGGVFHLVFHLVEVSFYAKAVGNYSCCSLGILVVGAEKVEAGVEDLKRNLKTISKETKAKVKGDQGLRTTWHELTSSVNGTRSHLKPVIRKVEPYGGKLKNGTKVFLSKTEIRARRTLRGTLQRTIDELEKLKRRLDDDPGRGWHAA
jgi:hypothetical protein